MNISKYVSDFKKGLTYGVPAVVSCATAITVVGQLLGATKINTIGLLFRDFQTHFAPPFGAFLPDNSEPLRFAILAGILTTQNIIPPLIEEVAFRWLLQDKILSFFTPRTNPSAKRVIVKAPVKNSPAPFLTKGQMLRIGIVAALFGFCHYAIPGNFSSSQFMTKEELGYESRFASIHSLGAGIAYGILYEKFGLAAAIGAHYIWNYSYDLWRFYNWKTLTSEQWASLIVSKKIQLIDR
ncbi:MAG: CPBP family intramembrane metalloprotease [Verrucomicrobia bacterium]|nr:CPBP family intramembrane metalloprotease [Verrucomicrobiota bacterium]